MQRHDERDNMNSTHLFAQIKNWPVICSDKENEGKQDYIHDSGSPCLKVCRAGKLRL